MFRGVAKTVVLCYGAQARDGRTTSIRCRRSGKDGCPLPLRTAEQHRCAARTMIRIRRRWGNATMRCPGGMAPRDGLRSTVDVGVRNTVAWPQYATVLRAYAQNLSRAYVWLKSDLAGKTRGLLWSPRGGAGERRKRGRTRGRAACMVCVGRADWAIAPRRRPKRGGIDERGGRVIGRLPLRVGAGACPSWAQTSTAPPFANPGAREYSALHSAPHSPECSASLAAAARRRRAAATTAAAHAAHAAAAAHAPRASVAPPSPPPRRAAAGLRAPAPHVRGPNVSPCFASAATGHRHPRP